MRMEKYYSEETVSLIQSKRVLFSNGMMYSGCVC